MCKERWQQKLSVTKYVYIERWQQKASVIKYVYSEMTTEGKCN